MIYELSMCVKCLLPFKTPRRWTNFFFENEFDKFSRRLPKNYKEKLLLAILAEKTGPVVINIGKTNKTIFYRRLTSAAHIFFKYHKKFAAHSDRLRVRVKFF